MEIIVGLDGSPSSWRAFSMALGVAKREKAFVQVCFVLHVPAPATMGPFIQPPPSPDDDGGELGCQVSEELREADVHGRFTCLQGDVAHELEMLAEQCHADLVVVGRSRHPALHLGGVPRRLLAMGRWPVLVVP